MEKKLRFSGVLLHPTSLPSDSGIGDFGYACEQFIDLLHDAGVGLWQILPLSPVGFGDSPYASLSAFAGEELFISLERLLDRGILTEQDLESTPGFRDDTVELEKVRAYKMPLLKEAARRFLSDTTSADYADYCHFLDKNVYWLEDYALFKALGAYFDDLRWYHAWPKDLAVRDPLAIEEYRENLKDDIEVEKVLQYFFHDQWKQVREYAHQRNIAIVGDIPIFVAHESADAWCHGEFLKLNEDGTKQMVAGVPPDAFSETGQLWGNPVYDWDALKADDYSWWVERIKHQLTVSDMVRIDHFRGFEAAWEVASDQETAEHGQWVEAPGEEFFTFLENLLAPLPFIAEDLGIITDEVNRLRKNHRLPGMKILQFAFNFTMEGQFDADHFYLPHTYEELCAAYTGTHDNNTTRGWYESLDGGYKDIVRKYLSCDDSSVVWYAVRSIMASSARYAIIPFQDVLEIGSEGRMNAPGTVGGINWKFRIHSDQMGRGVSEHLKNMVAPFGRTAGLNELEASSNR
ncbi:MAG: 4-alpha-glucanotransferase [Sphaerochaetaceae bacterium]|nr:4-alpha-glucanotransferase [Sphaerochaetaceae bacterium]